MQAKDISRDEVFGAIVEAMIIRGHSCATRWDIAIILQGHPEYVGTPELFKVLSWDYAKLTLAKLRKMKRSGLIDGCYCGCRGDFWILEKEKVV